MDFMFGDEIDYDICIEGEDSSKENASDLAEKIPAQKNHMVKETVSLLNREDGRVGFV